MTDERPKPYPTAGNKPCPYWGNPEAVYEQTADYAPRVAGVMAAVQAVLEGDPDTFKALCETMEPRDYAAAIYAMIDYMQAVQAPLRLFGHDARKWIKAQADQARDAAITAQQG
jgi:hypothetical protein